MKVIFLDIDGVLNSNVYDRQRTASQGNIDPSRLPLLKRLVDRTGAVIVLSTSWRKHWDKSPDLRDGTGRELHSLFSSNGLYIHDKTPQFADNDRAEEIRSWLSAHGEVSAFVILDDILFGWGTDLQEKLIRTNPRIGRGLDEHHIEEAIKILNQT